MADGSRQSVPERRRSFADLSRVRRKAEHTFEAEIDPNWTIGGKPNGGYLLAILGRTAIEVGTHPGVIAASAQYLRAPDPGAAVVEAMLLREGRSAGHIHARMVQGDRICVEALITTGRLDPSGEPHWDAGLPRYGGTAYEDCEPLLSLLPDGNRVSIMEQIDIRLDPGSTGFTRGAPSGRGELRGWLSLLGDESFDPISLLFAVDAFPPATFDIEFSGWVPTFELTVYVRALPAPGPVWVLQRAQLIREQRVDEACFVWDRNGRLVAQATQLAGIRLG